MPSAPSIVTGRCYCGAISFEASTAPTAVAYCHCRDCRRVTGAPVAAFAAFTEESLRFTPDEGRTVSVAPGVSRSFCGTCGTPLTGRYDYLPDRVFVPLGLLDQADAYPPELHSHHDSKLSWLNIDDDLERHEASARCSLAE